MSLAPTILAVFFAAGVQSVAGFGFALVITPMATHFLGIRSAVPLVALTACTLYVINLIRFRQAVNLGEVKRLSLAAVLGVPIGIWILSNVDDAIVKPVLGLILVLFGLYSLLSPRMPELVAQSWAYPAGFLAGVLGGAYNTPGPPLVVYGALKQWPGDEFRSVLQALFLLSSVLVIAGHVIAGNFTTSIFRLYGLALPALLLGVAAGSWIDRRLGGARFRNLINLMIVILGLSLMI